MFSHIQETGHSCGLTKKTLGGLYKL